MMQLEYLLTDGHLWRVNDHSPSLDLLYFTPIIHSYTHTHIHVHVCDCIVVAKTTS